MEAMNDVSVPGDSSFSTLSPINLNVCFFGLQSISLSLHGKGCLNFNKICTFVFFFTINLVCKKNICICESRV